jgi:hypothetical protein
MAPKQLKATKKRSYPAHVAVTCRLRVADGRVGRHATEVLSLRTTTRIALRTDAHITVSAQAPDTMEAFGYAISTAYRMGTMTSVRAVFDNKDEDAGDCTHLKNDDVGDECLRDFEDGSHQPYDPTPVANNRNCRADTGVFFGNLYTESGGAPQLVMASLVRKENGDSVSNSQ